MNTPAINALRSLIADDGGTLLDEWLLSLKAAGGAANGRVNENELRTQCRDFLAALQGAFESDAPTGIRTLLHTSQ